MAKLANKVALVTGGARASGGIMRWRWPPKARA